MITKEQLKTMGWLKRSNNIFTYGFKDEVFTLVGTELFFQGEKVMDVEGITPVTFKTIVDKKIQSIQRLKHQIEDGKV